MTDLTDAQINRAVAEAMGWKRHAYADADPKEVFCLSGGEWYWTVPGEVGDRCERCGADAPPDFLHDWQAFGRLWEHCVAVGNEPILDGEQCCASVSYNDGKDCWTEQGNGNERRALALAFLEAVKEQP